MIVIIINIYTGSVSGPASCFNSKNKLYYERKFCAIPFLRAISWQNQESSSDSLCFWFTLWFIQQAQQSLMSSHDRAGGVSLRRQPTYPPTGPSHSYRLHEASLFGSASSLYAYPASAALASVSQAVDQLHNSSGSSCSSSSGRHTRTAGPYSASLSLLQKNSAMGIMCQASAPYQQQQLSTPSYQRSAAFPLSQRKLNQYQYLWGAAVWTCALIYGKCQDGVVDVHVEMPF